MEKKLKVVLVDDEYLIRNLMRMRIDWEENGFEIIGEAQNATEAMRVLEENTPDIVFTDICMPNTDGIEFSRLAFEKYPNLKIVIITGHDEFEYAREALRLGISDYIMKPIRAQELLATIVRLKKVIENEKLSAGTLHKYLHNESVMGGQLAHKIRAYLQDNLHNPNLNLNQVAKQFHMSTGHLGRVIKQETGETFVSCLTSFRIQRAKELLKHTDLKNYMIGIEVGIVDPHYFSILFKKATGMSVNEYKKSQE